MRECTSCMAFFDIDLDILQKNEKEQKICIIMQSQNRKTVFVAVPPATEEENCDQMEVGYIGKKNQILSQMGQLYIEEMKRYFS